jgi:hypothetical protein
MQLASGVGLRLYRRQELTPDASLLPAVEATGHGTPRAIAFGQIPPGSPRAQHPENPVENAAMIDGRPTSLRFLGGSSGCSRSHGVWVKSPRFILMSITM